MRSESWEGSIVARDRPLRLDDGLRHYRQQVYQYMVAALVVSGGLAYVANFLGLYAFIAGSPYVWLLLVAPLALIAALGSGIERRPAWLAHVCFWTYAASLGIWLGGLFEVYAGQNIALAFLATAAAFAAANLFGAVTKQNLSGLGDFFLMSLVGIMVAVVVNIFLASAALELTISVLGALLFVGLASHDTQRLHDRYYLALAAGENTDKEAIVGALALYLDFINLFLFIIRLTDSGRRKP